MHINERTIGDITVLDLEGRLTIGDGAELLRDKVTSIVFQGRNQILLNLAGVPYMDSGGLGELVRCSMAARKANGEVKLVNLTSRISDLLSITKLLTVFETFESEPAALVTFRNAVPAAPVG
jgi:anti-sigma B factor antagonist